MSLFRNSGSRIVNLRITNIFCPKVGGTKHITSPTSENGGTCPLSTLSTPMNTGTHMLSPFIDSSVDNVLLQTSTSRFLSSTVLNGVWWTRVPWHCKHCNRTAAVWGHRSGKIKFIDVFLPTLKNISLVLLFAGSAETYVGWGENLNGYLMASCQKYS